MINSFVRLPECLESLEPLMVRWSKLFAPTIKSMDLGFRVKCFRQLTSWQFAIIVGGSLLSWRVFQAVVTILWFCGNSLFKFLFPVFLGILDFINIWRNIKTLAWFLEIPAMHWVVGYSRLFATKSLTQIDDTIEDIGKLAHLSNKHLGV